MASRRLRGGRTVRGMTPRTIDLTDALLDYVAAHDSSRDALSAELIAETRAALPEEYDLQVSSEEAGLLALLTHITGARDALEIGTFTGLSSLAVARALPAGGRLVCCAGAGGVARGGGAVLGPAGAGRPVRAAARTRRRHARRAARRAGLRPGVHRR